MPPPWGRNYPANGHKSEGPAYEGDQYVYEPRVSATPIILWASSRSVLVIPLQQKHTSDHLRDETFVLYLGNHKTILKRVMGDGTRSHHPDSNTQRDNSVETLWFT